MNNDGQSALSFYRFVFWRRRIANHGSILLRQAMSTLEESQCKCLRAFPVRQLLHGTTTPVTLLMFDDDGEALSRKPLFRGEVYKSLGHLGPPLTHLGK